MRAYLSGKKGASEKLQVVLFDAHSYTYFGDFVKDNLPIMGVYMGVFMGVYLLNYVV